MFKCPRLTVNCPSVQVFPTRNLVPSLVPAPQPPYNMNLRLRGRFLGLVFLPSPQSDN